MKTHHEIAVRCHPDVAFAMCINVERWPDIFPPCLDAVVLEESLEHQRISLTAKANDKIFSWESKRQIDRDRRTIEFAQVKISPLVNSMKGMWQVKNDPTPGSMGSIVSISHDFEIKEEVDSLVGGVSTQEEAKEFMLNSIKTNSKLELGAIKEKLDRQLWTHEFSEKIVLNQSKRAIYKLLRDASSWPSLLPHCNAIHMIYEDPDHQEFEMRVQVGEKEEVIRSIRFLREDRIDYFQPAPPPALIEHKGYWSVRDTEAGVELISWHSVVLNCAYWTAQPLDEAKALVESAINRNSLGTMQAIAKILEGSNHAKA